MIGVIFSIILSVRSSLISCCFVNFDSTAVFIQFYFCFVVNTSCAVEDSPVSFGVDFISVLICNYFLLGRGFLYSILGKFLFVFENPINFCH